jgi:hypothetical protein
MDETERSRLKPAQSKLNGNAMDSPDQIVVLHFAESTPFVTVLKFVKEVELTSKPTSIRTFFHEKHEGYSISTQDDGFRSGLEITQVTLIVSSIAALAKVLIELLKTFRVTVEIEYEDIHIKYEGRMTRELREQFRKLERRSRTQSRKLPAGDKND